MKEHLKHFFPFLNKDFRKLEESELQSEETFKELFPNELIDLSKLRTIHCFQNSDEFGLLPEKDLEPIKKVLDSQKPKTTKLKGKFSKEVINYLTDKDAKV